jgi:hypothetical protein
MPIDPDELATRIEAFQTAKRERMKRGITDFGDGQVRAARDGGKTLESEAEAILAQAATSDEGRSTMAATTTDASANGRESSDSAPTPNGRSSSCPDCGGPLSRFNRRCYACRPGGPKERRKRHARRNGLVEVDAPDRSAQDAVRASQTPPEAIPASGAIQRASNARMPAEGRTGDETASPAGWEVELDAMEAVGLAIDPLDGPARRRVLDWAARVFGVSQNHEEQSI